ncbi:Transposon Ty3-I Gag-Pol polyprotein [Gossypium australe]|uniref:Transposon Ty3-I Gag-Pol polyprotein n=1 Tax=Gossypium australe TaxID=47621 RepID=A0A5B6VWN0_9ROSI|nr:Transposon Ty3-I Gag-Pol polyprotein [Gossypium australe]
MKDPRSFTIPCNIGDSYYGITLYDLERTNDDYTSIGGRSLSHPEGKIKDILVCMDKFIFLVDFIVLDFETDKEVQIILGRPFLATSETLINVKKDDQVTFNVFIAMIFPITIEECSTMFEIEMLVSTKWELNSIDDLLERILVSNPHSKII